METNAGEDQILTSKSPIMKLGLKPLASIVPCADVGQHVASKWASDRSSQSHSSV